jgi:parallel beta helix pectate lyase-like protein
MSMSAPACTRTIAPSDSHHIREILDELSAGSTLCLKSGVYESALWVERSITIRGLGDDVILDGQFRQSTVRVGRGDVDLVLERLTLRYGSGGGDGSGGNLQISDSRSVTARDVVFEDGEADANGGGAILLHRGNLLLERCRLSSNHGARAQAILAEGGSLVLRDCLIIGNTGDAPAILLDEDVQAELQHTTIVDNGGVAIKVAGNIRPRPRLVIDACILGGPPLLVTNPESDPRPFISIRGSALSEALSPAYDAGDNLVDTFTVDTDGRVGSSVGGDRNLGPRRKK